MVSIRPYEATIGHIGATRVWCSGLRLIPRRLKDHAAALFLLLATLPRTSLCDFCASWALYSVLDAFGVLWNEDPDGEHDTKDLFFASFF